jgi:hypothetical protein
MSGSRASRATRVASGSLVVGPAVQLLRGTKRPGRRSVIRKWFGEPTGIGPKRGVSGSGPLGAKSVSLQAKSGMKLRIRFFLPCRRSWVRVSRFVGIAAQAKFQPSRSPSEVCRVGRFHRWVSDRRPNDRLSRVGRGVKQVSPAAPQAPSSTRAGAAWVKSRAAQHRYGQPGELAGEEGDPQRQRERQPDRRPLGHARRARASRSRSRRRSRPSR